MIEIKPSAEKSRMRERGDVSIALLLIDTVYSARFFRLIRRWVANVKKRAEAIWTGTIKISQYTVVESISPVSISVKKYG